MAAVSCWRARFLATIAAAGPVPALGSPAWVALPDTDPRKTAAAVGPAVAYLIDNTQAVIESRLRGELAAIDHAVVARIRTASWDLSGAQDWRHAAHCPSHADLVRRRSQAVCVRCGAEHGFTDTHCPGCGRGGTPEQIRAEATASWTTPTVPHRRVA